MTPGLIGPLQNLLIPTLVVNWDGWSVPDAPLMDLLPWTPVKIIIVPNPDIYPLWWVQIHIFLYPTDVDGKFFLFSPPFIFTSSLFTPPPHFIFMPPHACRHRIIYFHSSSPSFIFIAILTLVFLEDLPFLYTDLGSRTTSITANVISVPRATVPIFWFFLSPNTGKGLS